MILSNLPISSLLAFSTTNKRNQILAHKALQTLNLAVFPREIYCRLAFISQRSQLPVSDDDVSDSSNQRSLGCIAKTTGTPLTSHSKITNPVEASDKEIAIQNSIAANVLRQPSLRYLRTLTLNMYDITSPELISIIATDLPSLKHMELNLSHPCIHDRCLSSNYWREAPTGNPCWNALVGLGQVNQQRLHMRNLQTLRIERAGITSAQLRSLVTSNPRLRSIYLSNVTGVDQEFVQWLGAYCKDLETRLEEIVLENCTQLRMQSLGDFAWLAHITSSAVKRLSLWTCRNVNHELLVDLIQDEDDDEKLELGKLEWIVPPKGMAYHFGVADKLSANVQSHTLCDESDALEDVAMTDKIEVDPEYLADESATAAWSH